MLLIGLGLVYLPDRLWSLELDSALRKENNIINSVFNNAFNSIFNNLLTISHLYEEDRINKI